MSNWFKRRTLFYTTKPKPVEVTVEKHSLLCSLMTGLKRLCIVLGAIVLVSFILMIWGASSLVKEDKPTLPKQMVLFLKMDKSFPEKRGSQDYFSQFGLAPEPVTASDIIDALDKAATDDRVKGLVLSMRSQSYELAQLQELRAAVLRFKKSGKFTKVFAPSYGEAGSGLGMYYLASAFDEIWMQPVGVVSIAGLNAEMPYFKNILNKYGVKAQFFQRKEFKNAMENMTSDKMSPASRLEMTTLIGDLGNQVVTEVSQSRKKVANFRSLVDQGLFTDDEALKNGLIDRLDYGDVMLSELRVKIDGSEDSKKTGFTDIEDYVHGEPKTSTITKGKVAVVYIQGMILESGGSPPLGFDEKVADANVLAQAIRDAGNNKRIDTIVLRINSPGGSPSASETIRRAIIWAKEKKQKHIIVSMGSTAASGAYWISADADKIYADNATLTGSIGVLGGKFDLSGLFEKYDVNWDGVSFGKNSGMWAMNRGFNASEQERFEATLDSVYDHFTKIVAHGRKMSPAKVEELAKGRVWTGREAKLNGLVDQIGGLDMVLNDIAKSKGMPDRQKLAVVELPAPENPLQQLMGMVGKTSPFGSYLPPELRNLGVYLPLMQNHTLIYAPLPQF